MVRPLSSHSRRSTIDHRLDILLSGVPLENLAQFVHQKCSDHPALHEILKLCFVCIMLVDPLPNALAEANRTTWVQIFELLTAYIQTFSIEYPRRGPPSKRSTQAMSGYAFDMGRLAYSSLNAIDQVEQGWKVRTNYNLWLKTFNANDTLFSDELIDVLGQLRVTFEDDAEDCYRLRRLWEVQGQIIDGVSTKSQAGPEAEIAIPTGSQAPSEPGSKHASLSSSPPNPLTCEVIPTLPWTDDVPSSDPRGQPLGL